MNILLLTERLGSRSGWERYATELVRALQLKGNNVFVLCAEENQEIGDIPQTAVLPPALSSRRWYFLSWLYAIRSRQLLHEKNFVPDIIHSIVEPYACITHKLAKDLQRPYFITAHGSYAVRPFLSSVYRAGVARAYRAAKAVICISRYTEQQVKRYVPDAPTVVIPNGVTFSEGKNQDVVREQLILSVGIIKERKGYLQLLRALPRVREKVPGATLAIVGDRTNDAAYVEQLDAFIKENQLESMIQFKGKVSDAELNSLYETARVFALTPVSTQRSFEGFGLVYLEANAHGMPVIGSYGNGGEDAIIEGQSGFLVHVDNPEEIADRIISLLTMPQQDYTRMSDSAYAHARKFSWGRVVEEYEKVYENV
jgi:glycosyltransferase involved in cell wall biosynthesis